MPRQKQKHNGGSGSNNNNNSSVDLSSLPVAQEIMQLDDLCRKKKEKEKGKEGLNLVSVPSSLLQVLGGEEGEKEGRGIVVEQTVGERYTGGRSTPVYTLNYTQNKNSNHKMIAKIVILGEPPSSSSSSQPQTKKGKQQQQQQQQPQGQQQNQQHYLLLQSSYLAEKAFYSYTFPPTSSSFPPSPPSSSLFPPSLPIPSLIHSEINPPKSNFLFLMSNLQVSFPLHPPFLSLPQAHAALSWLAEFHAFFWEDSLPEGVWSQGTYYSPDKRPLDSLHLQNLHKNWTKTLTFFSKKKGSKFSNFSERKSIKSLNLRLEGCGEVLGELVGGGGGKGKGKGKGKGGGLGAVVGAGERAGRFMTLVHGDFKAANMFFSGGGEGGQGEEGGNGGEEGGRGRGRGKGRGRGRGRGGGRKGRGGKGKEEMQEGKEKEKENGEEKGKGEGEKEVQCAVCDFQFTGEGLGAQDVMYLLYPDSRGNYFDHEDSLLSFYHSLLLQHLSSSEKPTHYPFSLFQLHYSLCFVQFFIVHLSWSGWVASGPQDGILIEKIDKILSQFDEGEVLDPATYRSKMMDALLENE